ncbi:MAG: aminotransferase class V-fold PLP-dependent enzyme, partial [Actinobacteria bacterium]|nr:aminotransferase class V-fold PLP-dependent enzyme [Actinomycetota bacterium]
CISVDHPLFLSFVPGAPTESSVLFDLVVAASNIYAGSWLEGAGAVYAENQALRWIADLAGLPSSAGGVFVSGGTAGNLSALIAARWHWRSKDADTRRTMRPLIVASGGAHSSVAQAARVMDADIISTQVDERGKSHGHHVAESFAELSPQDRDRVCAIVATAGTTNVGVVDDLDGFGRFATESGVWFHVDGAYGAAALCAPSVRGLFAGIERADSMIVDPHKWLFGPYDSCALIYRDPRIAKAAHTQHAEYLDVLQQDVHVQRDEAWNPADLAHHLSRRARGLPLWFSLAMHGTEAYTDAMEATLAVTREAAEVVRRSEHLELVLDPELSVLVLRRKGWTSEQYQRWSDSVLERGIAFVVPSSWKGETVLRMCIVNPRTTVAGLTRIFDTLK